MEPSDWVPVIVAFIATAGVAITYLWQKHIDRKNDLFIRRRQSYTDLLMALNKQLTRGTEENLVSLNEQRAEVFLVATDVVAKSIGSFFKYQGKTYDEEGLQGSANNESIDLTLKYYAEMVLAMRKDCFEKSKMNILQTIECMPVQYSRDLERTIIK